MAPPSGPQSPRASRGSYPGSLIIQRDSPNVEVDDDETDPNSLSPRRSSVEIERMGDVARQSLIDRANEDQRRLAKAAEKLMAVKDLVHRLEQRNASLRSHIDEVMKSTNLAQAKPRSTKTSKTSRFK